MGHSRLGEIPKTRKWKQLVRLIAGEPGSGVPGEDGDEQLDGRVEYIAAQVLALTQTGLEQAIDDRGLRYTFYLLTQLVLAARIEAWQQQLSVFGIAVSSEATLFGLTVAVQTAIDAHITQYGHPTDVSEIAQQAIGEALNTLVAPRSVTLFGAGEPELQIALREFSSKRGFAQLGQEFFGSFMAHYLNFYLSRLTAAQMGSRALQQIGDLASFNRALQTHCRQSARIVHDFCGEWYSKTEFTQGITLENTSGFLAVALRKLQAELQHQEVSA